jgi:hypothetical protein
MDHAILRRDNLTRLDGPLVLGLHPLTVVGVHHAPSKIRVLALFDRVSRQGLNLGAHVYGGVRTPDFLNVGDRRHPLDERAVPAFGVPQPLLGPLALSNILVCLQDKKWDPTVACYDVAAFHYDASAVTSMMDKLTFPVPLCLQPAMEFCKGEGVNCLQEIVTYLTYCLLFRPTVQALRSLIPVDDPAV